MPDNQNTNDTLAHSQFTKQGDRTQSIDTMRRLAEIRQEQIKRKKDEKE